MTRFLCAAASLILWGAAAQVQAQAQVQPQARGQDCLITDYGAVADDETLDTAAIQAAVDDCRDRGGRVVTPAGRFVSGQIRLGSRMEFHLAPGAVLAASTRLDDFAPVIDGEHRAFVVAQGAEDLLISGKGVLDGQGAAAWPTPDAERLRFGLIVDRCRNVTIRDVTVRDTPMYLSAVKDCDNVVIDGVTLTAPWDSPNTDGLQIIDSADVRVSNCLISVGDDGVVTKARRRFVERLQITNCRISSDDGALKFGTRSESGVRDSLFSNLTITESRYGVALFMIHGGLYANNRFSNIRIATGGRHWRHFPIFVDIDDRADGPRPLGRIEGLTFDGLDITTAGNILIGGHPSSPVRDLTLTDIRMRVEDAQDLAATAGKPRGNRRFQPVPGAADHSGVVAHVVLGHVAGASVRGLDVRGIAPGDQRAVLALPNSSDVTVDAGPVSVR
ncbi:glycoside hydrolase family 28 protein [Brevundimonas balnearis]|uniref:Glycoside hydrolase family 28 protein n=1 Tax=Brevundimonas balnearis TaxID=1572858 RepID=A0ABV6R1N0_9CAUL